MYLLFSFSSSFIILLSFFICSNSFLIFSNCLDSSSFFCLICLFSYMIPSKLSWVKILSSNNSYFFLFLLFSFLPLLLLTRVQVSLLFFRQLFNSWYSSKISLFGTSEDISNRLLLILLLSLFIFNLFLFLSSLFLVVFVFKFLKFFFNFGLLLISLKLKSKHFLLEYNMGSP